jgi:hypothetical protein
MICYKALVDTRNASRERGTVILPEPKTRYALSVNQFNYRENDSRGG